MGNITVEQVSLIRLLAKLGLESAAFWDFELQEFSAMLQQAEEDTKQWEREGWAGIHG